MAGCSGAPDALSRLLHPPSLLLALLLLLPPLPLLPLLPLLLLPAPAPFAAAFVGKSEICVYI